MANANPSGPTRVQVVDKERRPEINIGVGEFLVRLKDGRVVHRKVMNTGNTIESTLSPGDYPDAITEKQFAAEVKKLTSPAPEESD